MQKPSNTKLISIAIILLSLLLVAKLISLSVWWFLPSDGVEYTQAKSYKSIYQRVNFKNMLDAPKKQPKIVEDSSTNSNGVEYSINNLLLKGLYGNKTSGYAIVAKLTQPEVTSVIGIGEIYAGYKLKEIYQDRVIFTKNSKDYKLTLMNASKNNALNNVITKVKEKEIVYEDEHKVTRNDINNYAAHPEKIWKDIGIKAYKKNGKITGFIVTRIKANSKMAQLGLQKGDIMIRANNIELTSPNDAINLYKNIKKIDTLELVVLRDGQEKEIIYEIR